MSRYESDTILILSPHTDDAELGCGGSIARWIEEGATVHVVAFSDARQSLPTGSNPDRLRKEFSQSMKSLGVPAQNATMLDFPVRTFPTSRQEILDELIHIRDRIEPTLVATPSGSDRHQDHEVIQCEADRVFRKSTIIGYELPWNMRSFSSDFFVELKQRHLDAKWAALSEYQSQIEKNRPYFSVGFFLGLAKLRGTQSGFPMAEAYEFRLGRAPCFETRDKP